ncbi:VOC family protein [Acidobacterium sp. S8]|uniref:VOC family protein n=1 Tax=Acidobacterium sp. S8 TaxID=1641854 RepID=UPI00131DF406|nr:VOC family protein [Acidobacterium sp. S8]
MSQVKPIPDGYHSIQPYLHIRGAAEALDFYKKAFGATERMRMPQQDGRIGHAELEIGDSVIMLADEFPEREIYGPKHFGGSAASIMLYVENCDAVYQHALAAGAKSLREPADQFYGDRSAGIEDPFGFQWWIGTHIKDVSLEELQKDNKG